MIEHGFLNLVWLAVIVFGLASAFRTNARRAAREGARRDAERKAARRTPAPPARPALAKPPVLAARPRVPSPLLQQPEAAWAFPEVDLSLPDSGDLFRTAAPGQARVRRGTAGFGGRRWATGAVIGAEVLGAPLALRPGATFGAPRAF